MSTLKRPCKAKDCGEIIRWHNIPGKPPSLGYFVNDEGPHAGERHLCINWQDPRTTKTTTEVQEQDQKLNGMINDLKSDISYKFSAAEQRLDNIQRTMITYNSLLQEVKAKLDMALRV